MNGRVGKPGEETTTSDEADKRQATAFYKKRGRKKGDPRLKMSNKEREELAFQENPPRPAKEGPRENPALRAERNRKRQEELDRRNQEIAEQFRQWRAQQ